MQKITLIGRLGKDAAIRETQNGNKFVSFNMAVNARVKGVDKTSWYDIMSYNFTDKMVQYMTKGSSMVVVGDLDADIETGTDGKIRIRRAVVADSITFNNNGSGQATDTTGVQRPSETHQTAARGADPDDDDVVVTTTSTKAKKGNTQVFTASVDGDNDASDLPF